MNFVKFLRTPFDIEHLWWLLLLLEHLSATASENACEKILLLLNNMIRVNNESTDKLSLREKCPNMEFTVRIFSYLVCLERINIRIQSDMGKLGPGKHPHLDTFHAVFLLLTLIKSTGFGNKFANNF